MGTIVWTTTSVAATITLAAPVDAAIVQAAGKRARAAIKAVAITTGMTVRAVVAQRIDNQRRPRVQALMEITYCRNASRDME